MAWAVKIIPSQIDAPALKHCLPIPMNIRVQVAKVGRIPPAYDKLTTQCRILVLGEA